jgi:hypothetical protein
MRHIHFESSFRRVLGTYVACLRFAPLQVTIVARTLPLTPRSLLSPGLREHVPQDLPEEHGAAACMLSEYCCLAPA